MKEQFITKILPHIAVLFVFILTTLITVPEAFKGKIIMHGDKMHSLASKRDVQELHQETGVLANWTDRSYSGMPTTLIYPIYPNNLASTIINNLNVIASPQVMYLLLPMLSMYLALMLAGYNIWWSLLASLIFGLSTINIGNVDAGHSSKVKAIATAMPLLIGLYLLLKEKRARGFLLLAGFGPLHLATNHLQITYYAMLIGAVIFVVLAIHQIKKGALNALLKTCGVIVLALAISVLPNTSMLWSNYDYAKESVRGKRILNEEDSGQRQGLDKDYANVFSHSRLELNSLFIPRVLGGTDNEPLSQSSNTYKLVKKERINWKKMDEDSIVVPLFWGDKPLNGAPTYIGIIAIVLMLIALWKSSRTNTILFSIALVLSLIIALGSNAFVIGDLLFDYLPFYNRFRAPSMILGLAAGIVGWALAAGLSQLNTEDISDLFISRKMKVLFGLLVGLCLFFALAGPSMYDFSWDVGQEELGYGKDEFFERQIIDLGHSKEIAADLLSALRDDRASAMRTDAFRALFLLVLVIGLFVLYQRKTLKKEWLIGGLVLLFVIDIMLVNKRYLTNADFSKAKEFTAVISPSAANLKINKKRKAFDRVVDFNTSTWIDAIPSYFHHNIGGNHAAKLRRYQDLIDRHLNKELSEVKAGKNNVSVPAMSMLNTRFVKTGFGEKDYLENTKAMGFAWLVDSVAWVNSAEDEIALIDSLNGSEFAIVHIEFKDQLSRIDSDSLMFGVVELRSKRAGEVVYKVTTDKSRLLVCSEIIYKPNTYWKSFIDGVETEHIRANYALRAIAVPAGQHEVRFEYNAIPFEQGEPIAAGGSALWLISILMCSAILMRNSITQK